MQIPKQLGWHWRPLVPLDGHPKTLLFGNTALAITGPKACWLKTKDPQTAKKYVDYLELHIIQHDLLANTQVLSQQLTRAHDLTNKIREQLDKINTLWIQGMLKAKRQCHKLHTGLYSWMPSITQLIQSIKYWQYSWKQAKGQPYHARILYRLHKALPLLPNLENMPQVDIQEYLQKHKEQLHQQIGDLDRWQTWLKEWPKHRPKCEALQLKNT